MHSNRYTFLYAAGFTALVAVILALAATGLRPLQEANIAQAKRQAILQSVRDVNVETLEADYNKYITEIVVNTSGEEVSGAAAFDLDVIKESKKPEAERQLPVFVYEEAGEKKFILPLQGKGLWGPISAFVALEEDMNTISGVVFEHAKETPGLGAEISMPMFEDRFPGKKIFSDGGALEAVRVLKGTGNDVAGNPHAVDGLSGATMTINGVTNMLRDELSLYKSYLEKNNS